MNLSQKIEIGDIKWVSFNNAMLKIREYNIEKKNALLNLHMNIKYTIENFKIIVDDFLKKCQYYFFHNIFIKFIINNIRNIINIPYINFL